MGSPIETWEGAQVIFSGAGGASPAIILILSAIVCFGAIVLGAIHEEHVYSKYMKK
jgi:shikimate 5-dehydrogenase